MLYLAIDQHRKQLTVNLRNEAGDVLLKRQVSTEWPRVREFLAEVQKQALPAEGFIAILEVCGFNDWLLKLLAEYGCRETILIQPEKQSKKKTDRRDANTLGEILWVNRQRLLAGKNVQGIRRVQPASEQDAADRQITAVRNGWGNSAHGRSTRSSTSAAETQPGAGMSHQGDRHDQRQRSGWAHWPWPPSTDWRWTSSWRSGSCGTSRSRKSRRRS